jgi:3,4-dihydroxy 2-butanone 4-phosphate synthase/GTP cyclohydrolase II
MTQAGIPELNNESVWKREVTVKMPTQWGDFELAAWRHSDSDQNMLALFKGTWDAESPVLVRLHSSCLTGDVFGSCRCDCGEQLHKAMEMVQAAGQGVILYVNQEGRGIGLLNKLRAYALQEQGRDTVDANLELGFGADERDYTDAAAILRQLGLRRLRLMTNNPRKGKSLAQLGFEIAELVPIEIPANAHNLQYLKTKREKLGHSLSHLG